MGRGSGSRGWVAGTALITPRAGAPSVAGSTPAPLLSASSGGLCSGVAYDGFPRTEVAMGAQRWLGVGQAEGTDPEAGARAADRALVHADAKLLIVFCSGSLDLPAVLRQVNERSGGVPL